MAIMAYAGIAATSGHPDRARQYLDDAVHILEKADMPLHLAAARRRQSEMRNDGTTESADQWMIERGVRVPASWTRMLVPGRFTPA